MSGPRIVALTIAILTLAAPSPLPLRAEMPAEQLGKIGEKVAPRDEKAVWNKKYDRKMYLFGKKPNVFFAEQLEKLTTETTCSVDKLVSETGFRPKTDLDKAVKAEIAWADQNNLL